MPYKIVNRVIMRCGYRWSQKGNDFPKFVYKAHEKHGCKSEVEQKIRVCRQDDPFLAGSISRKSTGRNQAAGQLRVSAMLRHK